MVEFAIGFSLLLTVFAGVYKFGYTFYVYNALETATRDGARYASMADYDGGAWNGNAFKTRTKNMVVYGMPVITVPITAKPVVPGLTAGKITVSPRVDAAGVPNRVTVRVDDFTIPDGLGNIFAAFTLKGKPAATFEYMGRFTVP